MHASSATYDPCSVWGFRRIPVDGQLPKPIFGAKNRTDAVVLFLHPSQFYSWFHPGFPKFLTFIKINTVSEIPDSKRNYFSFFFQAIFFQDCIITFSIKSKRLGKIRVRNTQQSNMLWPKLWTWSLLRRNSIRFQRRFLTQVALRDSFWVRNPIWRYLNLYSGLNFIGIISKMRRFGRVLVHVVRKHKFSRNFPSQRSRHTRIWPHQFLLWN